MPQNTTKSVLSTLCLTPTNLVSFWSFVFIEQILKIRQIYVQIDEYLTSEFWENTFFRQMFKKYPVYFSNWEKYSDNGIWRMCIRQTSKKICFPPALPFRVNPEGSSCTHVMESPNGSTLHLTSVSLSFDNCLLFLKTSPTTR